MRRRQLHDKAEQARKMPIQEVENQEMTRYHNIQGYMHARRVFYCDLTMQQRNKTRPSDYTPLSSTQ